MSHSQTDLSSYPNHIAFIMDGNGRWAKKNGLSIAEGHEEGGVAVQRCARAALDSKIPYITLYGFSSENWRRSEEEVSNLQMLLLHYLRENIDELHQEGVRFQVIGEVERFSREVREELKVAIEKTFHNDRLTLTLALSYGSRLEITSAFKKMAQDLLSGKISQDEIKEELVQQYLQTKDIPDPDVIVRTSGEARLSNFLLWQAAYSELVFLDIFWPEFTKKDFEKVLVEYASRHRRFGARS
ncbi:di-trans,poly-cis-decaprenylcistransferase [Acetobacteraceae bacterium]|nr:di-trans,poly-cis-decaprenylcistransferase [Acetobacteraceae bacterium]